MDQCFEGRGAFVCMAKSYLSMGGVKGVQKDQHALLLVHDLFVSGVKSDLSTSDIPAASSG